MRRGEFLRIGKGGRETERQLHRLSRVVVGLKQAIVAPWGGSSYCHQCMSRVMTDSC